MVSGYIVKNFTSKSDEEEYLAERGKLIIKEEPSNKDFAVLLCDIKYLLIQIRNKLPTE